MLKELQGGFPLRRIQRSGWLCLLLAISFLFNPFLAASSSSFGTTVISHLPSFRATVASSDLLKFTPKEKVDELPVSDCDVVSEYRFPVLLSDASRRLSEAEEPAASLYSPVCFVWFRPPPVA